jgi:predicted lysophospholipase L1 biosynthesis ABC-type transport system permease subunit
MVDFLRRRSSPPTDLMQIIGEVRSRWRMKLALRGLVTTFAVVLALVLVAAYAMEWARFSPASIIAARVLLAVGVVACVGYFLVRPLRRRVTDDQVALYLEENDARQRC